MPGISVFISDDVAEWLTENIGKGNISPYIQGLILKDKVNVEVEKDIKVLDRILNLALFFIGLAFIFLVISTNYFPGIGSFSYVIILITGGVLLVLQSGLRMVKKNGINSPHIGG